MTPPPTRTPEEETEIRELLGGRSTELPFTVNAMKVMAKRYLRKTHDGEILENPEGMFERVAKALATVEADYGASPEEIASYEKEFGEIMKNMEFTPAGRTLTNAGGPTRVVSNCIVLHTQDSMDSIFTTLREASMLQQAGSGLGFPFHLLRPAGSVTKASFGVASGPCSFLHVYNTAFGVIKQQNRHGANMAVMRVDHPDILEFIHCKDKEGSIKNFNVSVGLTDDFMTAVASKDPSPWTTTFNGVTSRPRRITRDANYNIVDIQEVDISAHDIFMEIVDSAWRTGEPGCVFLDTVNATNPLPGLGRIESCNPCGEQFLHDGDVCNLGSINLEKFISDDGSIMEERLAHVTALATRMLDNVVDISDFPVEKVNSTFRGNRRIGLGIMGMADALYKLRLGYNTQEGRDAAVKLMSIIQSSAEATSESLGKSKGVFPNWDKSVFAKTGVLRRNAAVTNIAPTGTIAMMFDVSGGVEPYFALAYHYKGILGGNVQLSYVNKHLESALASVGLNTPKVIDEIISQGSLQDIDVIPDDLKRVFVTSMDISASDHIAMQSAMQASVDNAISKTINFPHEATHDDILTGYIEAWKSGCKGCTVYRDGSRVLQVLNLNKDSESSTETVTESATETQSNSLVSTPVKADRPPASSPLKTTNGNAVVTVGLKRKLLESVETESASPDADEDSDDVEVSGSQKRRRVAAVLRTCPECGDGVTYSEGCFTCRGCGMSACSG